MGFFNSIPGETRGFIYIYIKNKNTTIRRKQNKNVN